MPGGIPELVKFRLPSLFLHGVLCHAMAMIHGLVMSFWGFSCLGLPCVCRVCNVGLVYSYYPFKNEPGLLLTGVWIGSDFTDEVLSFGLLRCSFNELPLNPL